MLEKKERRIGIVLSGGGAKGAYQTGVFRALAQLGLTHQIVAISGCSVGAYNALMYAQGGSDAVDEFMHRFEELACLKTCSPGPYPTEKLHEYLVQKLDADQGWKRIALYGCAYSLDRGKPEYFRMSDYSAEYAARIAIASGALLPHFPAAVLDAGSYSDGGVIPPTYSHPADKIPLKPLLELELDLIIVVFLTRHDQVDSSELRPGCTCVEITPSRELEATPGSGTMDFSPDQLASHEMLGFADTIEQLKTILI